MDWKWLAVTCIWNSETCQKSENPQEFVENSWRNRGESWCQVAGLSPKRLWLLVPGRKPPDAVWYSRSCRRTGGSWHMAQLNPMAIGSSAVLQPAPNLLCLELTRSNNDNWPENTTYIDNIWQPAVFECFLSRNPHEAERNALALRPWRSCEAEILLCILSFSLHSRPRP